MQNSVISTWISSIYGSQPSSVFFACKTAWLAPELLVSMGSSLHLCFFLRSKQRPYDQNMHVSMGPRPHLWFSSYKTAYLSSEYLVSMGPSPHLWFLHAKQRVLDQNYKSLLIPDLTSRFVHAKHHQNEKSIWVPAFICGFVHAKRRL